MKLEPIGIREPTALSYLPAERSLLALQATGELPLVTLFGDRAGSLDLGGRGLEPGRLIYDAPLGAYLSWNPGDELVAVIPPVQDGNSTRDGALALDLPGLGIESLSFVAADPLTGDLYMADGPRLVMVPFSAPDVKRAGTFDLERACRVVLGLDGGERIEALAIQPGGAHLLVATSGSGGNALYDLDRNGLLLTRHDLAAVGLSRVSAMVFGPASDPRNLRGVSLYLAGVGAADSGARMAELATGPAPPSSAAYITLVQAQRTSEWLPPSSDPAGIAYDHARGLLVVTDSEIDELARFRGVNVFFVGSSLTPLRQSITTFTSEPSDVAFDPVTGTYAVSDDGHARIYGIRPGADGALGGADDVVSSLSTISFGSHDPDGLSFGQHSIFMTDGASSMVYRLTAGVDGEFSGVSPQGDDVAVGFDTSALGVIDPEAVAYDPARGTLYLVTDERRPHLVEVTTKGVALRSLDLGFLPLVNPSGITLAPSSDDPTRQSIYLVDRGVDQSQDPGENDGLLFEVRIEAGEPSNSVRNGGFERDLNGDSLPDGWELTGGARVGAGDAHRGDAALRLAARALPASARYEVAVTPSMTSGLSFTGWVRAVSGTPGTVTARVSWHDRGGATLQTDRVAILTPTSDWVRLSGTTAPPPGAVEARLSIDVASGAILLDDVVLGAIS